MELISRAAVLDALERYKDDSAFASVVVDCMDIIGQLPTVEPGEDEWCQDCKEYDTEKHCCPRFNRVIRETVTEVRAEQKTGKWVNNRNGTYECSECGCRHGRSNFCPNCGARMGDKDDA